MASPPLQAEIKVMARTERAVLRQLSVAYSRLSKELTKLERNTSSSAIIRREQITQLRTAIRTEMADMWKRAGDEIRAGHIEAAQAAATLAPATEHLLTLAGVSRADLGTLERSLQLAASNTVTTAMRRIKGESYIPLSKRVYHTASLVSGQLDEVINRTLLQGVNARTLAKAVRDFIRPDTPGGASYAARRLARTEINNAFHATAVDQAKKKPFVTGVQWELSGSHSRPDTCNEYSEHNGGTGIWRPEDVPDRPHPNCMCYTTELTPSDDEFIGAFARGEYDDWLRGEGVDPGDFEDLTAGVPAPKRLGEKDYGRFKATTNEGLEAYKNYSFSGVNGHLRGTASLNAEAQVKVDRYIAQIDDLFANSPNVLSEDVVVMRGESWTGKYNPANVYKPGEYVVNPSYTSSTLSQATRDRFSREEWTVDVIVPKGTRVLVGEKDEHELLLPRNTRFRVESVEKSGEHSGHIVIRMEAAK